jgi:hypothetical protein
MLAVDSEPSLVPIELQSTSSAQLELYTIVASATIYDCPDEIVIEMFLMLNPFDLGRVAQVDRRFRRLTQQTLIWKGR